LSRYCLVVKETKSPHAPGHRPGCREGFAVDGLPGRGLPCLPAHDLPHLILAHGHVQKMADQILIFGLQGIDLPSHPLEAGQD